MRGDEPRTTWRRAETTRAGIALARIGAADHHRIAGPVDIRPESTTAWHPSLAYNNGCYMVSWVEQAAAPNPSPVYEATHGCTPP